jgi:hypothetical protein
MVSGVAVATLATFAVAILPQLASAAEPLSPYASVSGEHLALSVDALGSNNPAEEPIKVEKKDTGETVGPAVASLAYTATSTNRS